MEALRETIAANAALYLTVGGLVIGFLFGAIVYRTNFCTMGSISDLLAFGDTRRFRAWLLAGAVAILGVAALGHANLLDVGKSMYLTASLNWIGHLVGGLMFGFGMVLAGGCASRNLVRAGGGDLRSALTLLVVGLFAYMSIGGVIGPARAALEQATSLSLSGWSRTQSLGDIASALTGAHPAAAADAVALTVAGLVLAYCFKDPGFRSSPMHVLTGLGVGLTVVAGWALTGLAFDELAERPVQPISLTYVRPTGDALEWLQRYTALGLPGFGVATVFGAVAGSAAAALAMGRFKLTTFTDVADTTRNLLGGALMGIGGVMALGCTVGQAITGISTLALGSFLTFGAIVVGGMLGIKTLERMLASSS